MDDGLRGKTAVVTGADPGMGFETAKLLLGKGARIVISDHTKEALRGRRKTSRSWARSPPCPPT